MQSSRSSNFLKQFRKPKAQAANWLVSFGSLYLKGMAMLTQKNIWAVAILVIVAMVSLASSSRLHAQAIGTGMVQGTIQDSSGAVVSGATVTATNTGTNLKTTEKTSGSGSYTLPNLPAGDYTVEVKAQGFEGFEQTIHVEALAQVGLNVTLKVGAQTEKVVISANEQPLLNTENGQVGDVIPAETYDDLPVGLGGGTKSPIAYITLTPGVTGNGTSSFDNTNNYVFNGGIDGSSQLYVNGLPLPSSEYQGGWENLSSVMTAEIDSFTVLTSGVPAYYDGQGIANMLYKSGTNQFHGDIFENLRNTAFDAAPYF